MLTRTLNALACAAALALMLTACGGSGGRPSAGEVSEAMMHTAALGGPDERMTSALADCYAEAMVASDMTDEALRAIADSDMSYESSRQDLEVLSAAIADCAGM